MFTAEHYVKIALLLKRQELYLDRNDLTHEFARMFQEDNPKFSYEEFIDACVPDDISKRSILAQFTEEKKQ